MGRPKSEDKHQAGAQSSRRGFLKLAASAPAAVAVTTAGAASAEIAEERPTALGLRKTEHVRKYLDSCRF